MLKTEKVWLKKQWILSRLCLIFITVDDSRAAHAVHITQGVYLPECWCVWRPGPVSQTDPWEERWPCPSCTRRRWCCTDTVGSERQWTHRSCSETSSTMDRIWSRGNRHCPTSTHKERPTHTQFNHLWRFVNTTDNLPHQTLLSFCGWSQRSACCETFRF